MSVLPRGQCEDIGPDEASKILEGNTHNRQFSNAMCLRYQRDMEEGRWKLNGEPIIISDKGKLLDGQHRLFAVLQSGKTIRFMVVRGIAEDTFATINTGTSRKGKDVLSIKKVDFPTIASAVCKLCVRHKINPNLSTKMVVSNDEVLEFYEKNKALIDEGCELGNRAALKRLLPPSLVAFVVAKTRSTADRTKVFFESLETGIGLTKTDPVYTLRERLIRDKESTHGRSRSCAEYTLALVIKAWNAFINDRPLLKISYAPDKENYPQIETATSIERRRRAG